jgi:hypothetical protein
MKRALKKLIGYDIKADDGTKGTVKDFLFDEESWTIRYMVADLGKIFPGRKVLIPQAFLDKPDWDNDNFHVRMNKEDIKNSPELDEHLPVSRAYEARLHEHYQLDNYWPVSYGGGVGMEGALRPATPVHITDDIVRDEDYDTNLRSFSEVKNYDVECVDKKKGHVTDFIFDDTNWQIVYMVVDISPWYSASKDVMVAVNWMNRINYPEQSISINQSSRMLEEAPEFDASETVNQEYESYLYDYYGRKSVRS